MPFDIAALGNGGGYRRVSERCSASRRVRKYGARRRVVRGCASHAATRLPPPRGAAQSLCASQRAALSKTFERRWPARTKRLSGLSRLLVPDPASTLPNRLEFRRRLDANAGLGMETTAEAIETRAERPTKLALGCTLHQVYPFRGASGAVDRGAGEEDSGARAQGSLRPSKTPGCARRRAAQVLLERPSSQSDSLPSRQDRTCSAYQGCVNQCWPAETSRKALVQP